MIIIPASRTINETVFISDSLAGVIFFPPLTISNKISKIEIVLLIETLIFNCQINKCF